MESVKANFFTKVYRSIQAAVVKITEDKTKGDYLYGRDNLFPNKLLDVVSDSGTAASCITIKADFIYGDGFADENVGKELVNPNETFDALLDKISPYSSTFEAVVFNVQFGTDGQPAATYNIPFQTVRKKKDGTFKVNPNYGLTDFKEDETIIYKPFNKNQPPEERLAEVAAQIEKHRKQLGQILYVFRETPKAIHYPVPDYFSGIDDVRADAEMSKMEIENAINGFMPSAILTLIGEVDNATEDEDGKTDQDKLDETLMSFTGAKGGRSKLAVMTAKTKEAVPVLQSFDAKAMFDAINGATDRLARKVCRHMGVPPVLIGLSTPGQLGNNQELANYMQLFVFTVLKNQKQIIEALNTIYPDKDFSIAPLQLLKYVPDKVWDKLTDDEIRALGGYAPLPVATNATADQTITAINSLSPLVANKVLESLTKDEIRNLVGLPPSVEPTLTQEIAAPTPSAP